MKKIWLIAFIFNGLIFFSSAQTIENNFIVSADNNLFDLTTNLKIKFPLLQINTSFSKDKFNFGLSLSDEKLNKPLLFTVKTGNLTTSGILSSLNNPLLSSYISPFSNPDLQIRQIETNLPDISTFNKPISCFSKIGIQKINSLIDKLILSLFYNSNTNDFSLNLYSDLFFNKYNADFSYTINHFNYEELNFTSWFNKNNYYTSGKTICQSFESVIKNDFFNTDNSLFIFTSPFGKTDFALKNENNLKTKNFTFSFSDFILLNSIFTSSAKFYEPVIQIKNNLQYKFNFQNRHTFTDFRTGKEKTIKTNKFLKLGNTFFYQYNFNQNSFKIKNSSGINFSSNKFTFNNNLNLNFENINLKSFIFATKINFLFSNLQTDFNLNCNFYPDEKNYKTSQTLSGNFSYSKNKDNCLKLDGNFKIIFNQKNFKYTKSSLSASITGKIILNKIYGLEIKFTF